MVSDPVEEKEESTGVSYSRLKPGLYPVATPIGNLQDFTIRALGVIKAADVIACEDTRHSVRLLKHYEVPHKPLLSLNEHNEGKRIPEIIARIQEGASVALVSDAGTPTVSDPGQRLVHAVAAAGLRVEGIPGPSAVTTALSACGLPTTPFYFGGFLPHKKGQRTNELNAALVRDCTSIFFESPYRLANTLQILAEQSPDRPVVVARELTKLHETYHRGTASELCAYFAQTVPKGEMCLLIAPSECPKWMLGTPEETAEDTS